VSSVGKLFEKQGLHFVLLVLLTGAVAAISRGEGFQAGSYRGLSTTGWLWLSIAVPILHQVWVVVCWRLELHQKWLSRHLGYLGFRLYAIIFLVLFVGRIFPIIGVSIANQESLDIDQRVLNAISLVIAVLAIYLFYSVARHFSFRRALGIDHFDPSYRDKPFVRQGIFRFTRNGMYIFGIAVVWLPGLLYASEAGLLAAAFSHLYIWVHYFCTELPDMRRIYGDG